MAIYDLAQMVGKTWGDADAALNNAQQQESRSLFSLHSSANFKAEGLRGVLMGLCARLRLAQLPFQEDRRKFLSQKPSGGRMETRFR